MSAAHLWSAEALLPLCPSGAPTLSFRERVPVSRRKGEGAAISHRYRRHVLLALGTRRATGFYKVPSLRGLWYRGMFPHDGSCATLEDWFDLRRVREDYVPTGFKGHDVTARAVPGHNFGLNLSPADKSALIAFLKTL